MRVRGSRLATLTLYTFVGVLFCIGTCIGSAQVARDSKGTDFWIAFPPNDRSQGGNNEYLTIFITSEFNTTARITATRRSGQVDVTNLTIPANTVVATSLSYSRYELIGADFPTGNGQFTGDCERPSPASVHVTVNDEATVYTSTRELFTSDAWLVLPTDALGTDYRIFSYLSDAVVDTSFFGNLTLRQAFPGQFVIVATEDSTDVTMTIRGGRTSVSIGSQRSVRLNKGQAFLVQAAITAAEHNDDITGSRVRSTKPIAVISGHFRAQIPILSEEGSRDILVEQVPSVDTWGKHVLVVPLSLPSGYFKAGSQDVPVLRILAHEDGTEISINGGAPFPFTAGSRWDRPLTQPTVVDANKPILCGILDRTTKRSGNFNRTGDPSLILVPPTEQFMDHYQVISIEPNDPATPVYTQQFITVTIPTVAIPSLTINGTQPVETFTPIAGTQYSFSHISVSAGSHIVASDSAFGIIIYGYGPAESYGYTGGMAFMRLYQPAVTLRILDRVGSPGDELSLVAVVDSISEGAALDALAPQQLQTNLEFNRSMFVPRLPSYLTADVHRATVHYDFDFDTLRIGDTVSLHAGTVVLGDAETDTLDLTDVQWFDASQNSISIDTRIIRGTLTVTDICKDNGSRLFDPYASTARTIVRYFDLTGRELLAPQQGWSYEVTSIGTYITTTRVYKSN